MTNTNSEEPAPRASVDAMLQFAWRAGVFTISDALPEVGLTRWTSIEAVDDLLARKVLRELPNARDAGNYRKGRPARRFELRADAAVVVGMDAGRGHLTTVVADLLGATLAQETVELQQDPAGGDERRASIDAAIDEALRAAGSTREEVLSVGVGVPAPVDEWGESPVNDFWRLMNPQLHSMLGQWAPIVRVENDATLAAVAEGAVGAAVGCRNYIALLAGERFGAGVVVDGRLLRGRHGGVGELHAMDHVIGVESAWGLGHRMTEWAREDLESGLIGADHPLARMPRSELTGRAVLELAGAGDQDSLRLVERAGSALARVGGVLGSLFDPELIVISGAVAAGATQVITVAQRLLPDQLGLPAPELAASTLGAEVVALGAVHAALQAAREGVLTLGPTQLPVHLR